MLKRNYPIPSRERVRNGCSAPLGTVGFSISTCEMIIETGESTPEKRVIPVSPRPGVADATKANPRLTDDERQNTKTTTRNRWEALYHGPTACDCCA